VILVDDGSTDNTREVVESLLTRHPLWRDRLQYLWQENQGKSVALNSAMGLARGKWIAFNDSDDLWSAEKLEWQFRALAEFPECGACFTESSSPDEPCLQGKELLKARTAHPKCFSPKKGPFGKIEGPSWLFCERWPDIYMQSFIVREDIVRQCGEFDPSLRIEQDADFLFRLGLVTPFCYVELPLVQLRRDPTRMLGLSTNYPPRSRARLDAEEARLRKWLRLVGESYPALRGAIRHAHASLKSEEANRHILNGNVREGRLVLREGMRQSVEVRLVVKWIMTFAPPGLLRKLLARRTQVLKRTGRDANSI
jgi:glycosyltransferase involved in cell wall biosynthesis